MIERVDVDSSENTLLDRSDQSLRLLESLPTPALINVLIHLSVKEQLALRLLSKKLKEQLDTIFDKEILIFILHQFVNNTLKELYIPRDQNHQLMPFPPNNKRRKIQILKLNMEFINQHLKYQDFFWRGFSEGWRLYRIMKKSLQMMIDATTLVLENKLSFAQATELNHILKDIDTNINFCLSTITPYQIGQIVGHQRYQPLEKACDRIMKVSLPVFAILCLATVILMATGIGSAITPFLFAGILLTVCILSIAVMTPLLVKEAHKTIVAHRLLNQRAGFVNNLHLQFEGLKSEVQSSAESVEMVANNNNNESAPLLL